MRRESDHCPFHSDIDQLNRQSDQIEKFVRDAEPLLDYVRAEIERNKRRAEFYQKISERVLGTAILAIVAIIGAWILEKLRSDFGTGR